MNNNYETPEALVLGQAKHVILGSKEMEYFDDVLGIGWRWLVNDIDEGDE